MNVADFIQNKADTIPNHIAIIDNGITITYSRLNQMIIDTVGELRKQGIQQHNGVAVLGANSVDFIVMAFAVMQMEAVVLPLPDHLSKNELVEFIESSELHYICFNKSYPGFNGKQLITMGLFSKWLLWKNESHEIQERYASHVSHPALVRFTSGTTGTSKGVILSHQTIYDRIEAANAVLKLNSNDKIIWVLSMAFHFVVSIILYLKNGCTIILSSSFLAKSILEDVNKYHATLLYASPMHIRLLGIDDSKIEIPSVTRVISTSTGISKEQCDTFFHRYKIPVTQAYGIIEIGLPVINLKKSFEHPDAIGYALPGYDVSILSDTGVKLKDNEIGNLAIAGPGMFDGYLRPACSRDDVLKYGYFFTGDLAKKLPDGLISVEGRKKSMINVGGNKVFPEEVEGVLMLLPEIKNCRVSGYKHPLLGESVMAEIQLIENSTVVDTEIFYQYCKSKLSSYKVPQKILIVDGLPLTKSGKIIR